MDFVRKGRLQPAKSRRLIVLMSVSVLLIVCLIAVLHFATAPSLVESDYHRIDTPVYRCLACHYFGNTGRKMKHRKINFCFPCHRLRKSEPQKLVQPLRR